jgi:hypothetical protein
MYVWYKYAQDCASTSAYQISFSWPSLSVSTGLEAIQLDDDLVVYKCMFTLSVTVKEHNRRVRKLLARKNT